MVRRAPGAGRGARGLNRTPRRWTSHARCCRRCSSSQRAPNRCASAPFQRPRASHARPPEPRRARSARRRRALLNRGVGDRSSAVEALAQVDAVLEPRLHRGEHARPARAISESGLRTVWGGLPRGLGSRVCGRRRRSARTRMSWSSFRMGRATAPTQRHGKNSSPWSRGTRWKMRSCLPELRS